MEKLIELLNEYELEREKGMEEFKNWALPLWEWSIDDGDLVYDAVEPSMNLERACGDTANGIVISKSYGFIKWLVDNDKIDFEKYRIMDTRKYLHQHIIGNTCYVDIRADVPNYEFILALLSIQDEPIEFLISILK